MLWFLSLAQAAGFIVASYRDEAVGMMGRNAEKRVAITKIELRPEIRFEGRQPSPEELDHLHHEAHDRCFIANSLSTEIVVAKG
jgi:organic hydroperoxide reductase OsmC/OhrA